MQRGGRDSERLFSKKLENGVLGEIEIELRFKHAR